MMRRAVLICVAAMCIAACTQKDGNVYAVKIDDAWPLLSSMCLPPSVFGDNPPACEVRRYGTSEMHWIAKSKGGEVFRYVATLTDEGKGRTRVRLAFKGAEQSPEGNVAKRLADNKAMLNLYMVGMTENIASTLEQRAFNTAPVYAAKAAVGVANLGNIRSPGKQVDEIHAASQKRARDNIEKAYREERSGRR